MRNYEVVTIYLAAGASFGASVFLRREANCPRRIWMLVCGTLLWPGVAASILYRHMFAQRLNAKSEKNTASSQSDKPQSETQARCAERELHRRLYDFEDTLSKTSGMENEKWRQILPSAHAGVEKYAGLMLAAVETQDHFQPDEREMELCRAAGRANDELIVAGRCVRRRNRRRLAHHRARARTQFVNALASLENIADFRHKSPPIAPRFMRLLSEQVLAIYCHAFDLASLLDDQTMAMSVAPLINAGCARLRTHESVLPVFGEKERHNFTHRELSASVCADTSNFVAR